MDKKLFTFKYNTREFHRTEYVNGAYGGLKGQPGYKEIFINFFQENIPLPTKSIHNIKEGNQISKNPVKMEPTDLSSTLIRDVVASITMNIHTAKGIVSFLQDQIRLADEEDIENE